MCGIFQRSRMESVAGFEAVAYPGIGDNVARRIRRGLDLFAELSHEHSQVFNLLCTVTAPDGSQQGAMCHNFSRVARKIHQQIEFFWGEVDSPVLYRNAACPRINLEIA